MSRLRFLYMLVVLGLSPPTFAAGSDVINGSFSHEECIACHQRSDASLVAQWQQSVHATKEPLALCTSCHGEDHKTVVARSRRNDSCIDCHGGTSAPVVHSYTSSKHGVIMQLEKNTYDWNLPLREANYRAPGCAYCHLHDGDHSSKKPGKLKPSSLAMDRMTSACFDCHGARYITQLNDNASAMMEIANMKMREALQLVEDQGATADSMIARRLTQMEQHLRNVYLGAYHQSPDYQWWHGQPALDGDLIRIRGMLDHGTRTTGDAHE